MIKKYTLIVFFALLSAGGVMAQCPSCTPVFSTCPPAGGLCNRLDTAYAHHPFNKVINFYMPKVITDPALLAECDGCSQIDLLSITVTGVSGLPAGVNYLISNNGYFNVQGGDSIGCASFCGTPLLAGMYVVTVYLEADVTAVGTPIGNVTQNNNPQQYLDTLWVLPDTVPGVSSFTYGNNGSSACDSITISLNALLSAPLPNPTRYFWTIGNVETSQEQSPGTFTFTNYSSTPDTIPVTLTTIFYNYEVQNVHISSISGGFCGSGSPQLTCWCLSSVNKPNAYVDFPLLGYDNSSNYVNSCSNINFDNLNVLIPPGTQTLTMQLWDLDASDIFHLYSNQDISNYSLNVLLGQYQFSDNNAYGYVQFDTVAGTTITETLNVIVNPTPRIPHVIASKDSFCTGDSVFVSVDTASFYPGFSYAWYRDTIFLSAYTDSGFYTSTAGKYRVVITNPGTGCSVFSGSTTVSSFTAANNPGLAFTGTQIFINPLLGGFAANWYYNGNLVTGQNGDILNYIGNGTYSAEIYNTADTACNATLAPVNVHVLGIEDAANNAVSNLILSPNPNSGLFHLQFSLTEQQNVRLSVEDMIGQVVYNRDFDNFSGSFNQEIDLSGLSKGIYMVSVETPKGRQNRKVVVQ